MNSTPMENRKAAYNTDLFSFLKASPTAFHAIHEMSRRLDDNGFTRLEENDIWTLLPGSYYVVRDGAALLAFTLGSEESAEQGFRAVAAHTDSPALQVKPRPELSGCGCRRLGVEVYGGAILSSWFDRDLSLAGRVAVRLQSSSSSKLFLIHFDTPLLSLPSLAIHLNRDNTEKLDRQQELPPIIMETGEKTPDFSTILIARLQELYPQVDFEHCEPTAFDLFCHDLTPPCLSGLQGEFIHAGRLDNLLSCHAGITAITGADRKRNTLLYCSNHEETGSLSISGAQGNFLSSVLSRILPDPVSRSRALASSFCISLDNAHATHPNYPEKSDSGHEIRLNKGPVIKYNASQRYATSAATAAIFCDICHDEGITPQKFVMRSDMPCGSTIGPMTSAALGIRTVDVGAASLAMHSIREMTGSADPLLCSRALSSFFTGDFHFV
jgi:aspartyl aminopeptidase